MGAKCLPITTKATKLFLGLAFFNLGGMILGTFCFNTWLSCTLFLSLFIWIAILIYTFQSIVYLNKQKAINHYKNPTKIDSKSPVWTIWLANFFPQGTPLWLAPLMVPIEIISYCIRPVSMGLRLCGNLVAGHVLLIIIWDVISILSASLSNINIINSSLIELTPLLLYYSLFSLELAVAIIQAYVLTLLSCTFIKEAIEIH
jgi:F0F1-type ATP synthase membrane subunit a